MKTIFQDNIFDFYGQQAKYIYLCIESKVLSSKSLKQMRFKILF